MFGIGLGSLVKIGFRVSDHILKQQEIERSRTASERARLEAQASRERAVYESNRYQRTRLEDEIARDSVAVECPNCGATGNRIRIDFAAVDAVFVKVVFTLNSSSRTGGAQAAEICVY